MKLLKLPFLSGIALSGIFGLLAIVLDEANLLLKLTGWTGLLTLGLAMIISGALVSGDRMRANTKREQAEDRRTRIHLSTIMLYLSIPNLLVFAIKYFLYK